MPQRVLITGITGFVGSHLAEFLLSQGLEVFGTKRWRSKMDNIEHLLDKINLIEADVRDSGSLLRVVSLAKPDFVFHLAAQTFVQTSFHSPEETLATNVLGTLKLLESIRMAGIEPTVLIVGSSEEYGLVYPDELPVKETNPLRPLSPYAVSKVAQDRLGLQYHKSYGMKIVVTRAFNHEGPRRGEVFAPSNFSKQVAEIEKGKREFLEHGNLEAKRDFSDVRDIVRAYWLAVTKCTPGEVYNICSEQCWSIREMLDILLSKSSVRNIKLKPDPSRMRPSDVNLLLGDCSKFKSQTDWSPEIPFEKTMEDLLNYWRERV